MIWVLHAMIEHPADVSVTHHELREMRAEAGEVEPLIVGSVNLDELTTTTGIPPAVSATPGNTWRRPRWRDLAARLSIEFDDSELAPCSRCDCPGEAAGSRSLRRRWWQLVRAAGTRLS